MTRISIKKKKIQRYSNAPALVLRSLPRYSPGVGVLGRSLLACTRQIIGHEVAMVLNDCYDKRDEVCVCEMKEMSRRRWRRKRKQLETPLSLKEDGSTDPCNLDEATIEFLTMQYTNSLLSVALEIVIHECKASKVFCTRIINERYSVDHSAFGEAFLNLRC